MKRIFSIVVLLSGCTQQLWADQYVAPFEDAQILRVDRLPLDAPTMVMFSQALTTLAQRQQEPIAEQLRCNAQLLALALRLDANNEQAKKLNKMLQRGRLRRFAEPEDIELATRRIREILQYIGKESAGREANLLAEMTKDTLLVVGGLDEAVAEHEEKRQRWAGGVANLSAYRAQETAKEPVVSDSGDEPVGDALVSSNEKLQPELGTTAVVAEEATQPVLRASRDAIDEVADERASYPEQYLLEVSNFQCTSLYRERKEYAGSEDRRYSQSEAQVGVIALSIRVLSADEPSLRIVQSGVAGSQLLEKDVSESTKAALETRWKGDLPNGLLEIRVAEGFANLSRSSMAASATMAAESMLRAEGLSEKLVVGFGLSQNGRMIRPSSFWPVLQRLCELSGPHRVLVVPDSEEDFMQLISLDRWECLLSHEVVGVVDFDEALLWGSATTKNESLAQASMMFEEIRKTAPEHSSKKVFLKNPFVREKLTRILELWPQHISAKVLLAVGASESPQEYEDRYFAMEMMHLTREFQRISRVQAYSSLSSVWAYELNESLEQQLAEMEPFVSAAQQELYEKVIKMNAELRSLARSLREKDVSFHQRQAIESMEDIKAMYLSLQDRFREMQG